MTILCAEIPCWVGDEVWESSDGDIGEIVLSDLKKLGLPSARYIETHTKSFHLYTQSLSWRR